MAVSSVWEFMVGSEAQKRSAGRACYKRGYLVLFLVEHMRPILERLWCSVRKLERPTRGRKLHYVGRGRIRGECSLAVQMYGTVCLFRCMALLMYSLIHV